MHQAEQAVVDTKHATQDDQSCTQENAPGSVAIKHGSANESARKIASRPDDIQQPCGRERDMQLSGERYQQWAPPTVTKDKDPEDEADCESDTCEVNRVTAQATLPRSIRLSLRG